MLGISELGRFLIIAGIVIIVLGIILMLSGKISWLGQYFGKLPGDIIIQRKNFTFYFPLVTSILLSILVTLIFWIIWLIGRR
jgi:hypothetical protein